MPLYFAYGSNLSPVQMAERCPGSVMAGRAVLAGWRFVITTTGTANIVAEPGGVVHGGLWHCDESHLLTLDGYEGVRVGAYRRLQVSVDHADGAPREAIVYVSGRPHPGPARLDYMLTAVLPGAEAFGLPASHIAELRGWLPTDLPATLPERYRGDIV
ncbi:MAG: gamma-glutamylcyclotransferase family protein [Hyphomicrobiaceae bacterium]